MRRGRQIAPDWMILHALAVKKNGEARQTRNFGGHLSLTARTGAAKERTLGKKKEILLAHVRGIVDLSLSHSGTVN